MKNQALLSSKDKSKTLICRLPQFLFSALRFKMVFFTKRDGIMAVFYPFILTVSKF